MHRIFLVAIREFRQIAAMRSFWLTLLILPVALSLGPITKRFVDKDEADRLLIIDQTGGAIRDKIVNRIAREQDRAALSGLSRYVRRFQLEAANPQALWASHDRWYSEADVAAFRAQGGLSAALRDIARVKSAQTPVFTPPRAGYMIDHTAANQRGPGEAISEAQIKTLVTPPDKKTKPVNYVLLIAPDFAAKPVVRLWTNHQPDPGLVAIVQDVLTRDLRSSYLVRSGMSADAASAVQQVVPQIAITTPPPGGGVREAMLVRSILPLASAYMLLMCLMLSGSWMLQGTVEERSNKLIETVLACVSPEELMYGKLLGTMAIGLTMIAVWIGCALIAGFATHGEISDLIRPALDPLTSPAIVAAMLYFFIAGYLSVSIVFLAIGGLSDSMRDAQGYLMPVILVIMLPTTFLLQAIVSGKTGVGVEVLTWVPIWTPFAVLSRLGTGIPAWEVIGSGLVLAAYIAIEMLLLGRLFRVSLLAQGQKPNLREIVQRLKHQPE